MLLDKDHFPGKIYNDGQRDKLAGAWLDISDEYFTVKNDSRAKMYLRKRQEELVIIGKINLYAENIDRTWELLQLGPKLDKAKLAELIEQCYATAEKIEPKTKIKREEMISANLKHMESMLQSLANKYKLKYKQKREIAKKELENAYDMVIAVEEHLGRSLSNIDNMTVAQWISYEKQAKRRADSNKNKKVRKNGR